MLDSEFRLKPSRSYAMLFAFIIISALLIIVWLPLPGNLIGKLLLLSVILAYTFYYIRQFILLNTRSAILSLRRLSDGEWLLKTKLEDKRALLCGDSTLTNLVSVLNFRLLENSKRKSCIVFKDSLSQDQYRRLMIALRFG